MIRTKDIKFEVLRPEDVLEDPAHLARFQESMDLAEAARLVRTMRERALRPDGRMGITQADLAARIEVSQARISQIESGEGRDGPSFTLLKRISRACGIRWPAELPSSDSQDNKKPYVPETDRASGTESSPKWRNKEEDLATARALFESAWKTFGPDHLDTATSANSLAVMVQDQGHLAEAQSLFKTALVIREKALGPDHPDIATSLNNLASLFHAQGDLAGVRQLYERALAIREKALGPDHPDTATTLNNLAVLLQAQGDLAGARPLYERALAIREKVLGPDHPDTAGSLNKLAIALRVGGQLDAAQPLFERALAIREKALGPDHPDTAGSLNNLAIVLRARGQLDAAQPLFERALAIREKALGPDHPDTARVRNNLAALMAQTG
jgi:tetratricopeptide (TPR) repeat protein